MLEQMPQVSLELLILAGVAAVQVLLPLRLSAERAAQAAPA
jgi:hypothetical protein